MSTQGVMPSFCNRCYPRALGNDIIIHRIVSSHDGNLLISGMQSGLTLPLSGSLQVLRLIHG